MDAKSLLIEILKSKNCWVDNEPEIPEEISAQFDIGLNIAMEIVEFFSQSAQQGVAAEPALP